MIQLELARELLKELNDVRLAEREIIQSIFEKLAQVRVKFSDILCLLPKKGQANEVILVFANLLAFFFEPWVLV